jgi:hypothetical protein
LSPKKSHTPIKIQICIKSHPLSLRPPRRYLRHLTLQLLRQVIQLEFQVTQLGEFTVF